MERLIQRINEVKDYYKMSNRGFATAIGVPFASTNNYLNGAREPKVGFIIAVLSAFADVSAEWLMRGTGSMFIVDKQTSEEITRELADAKVKMLVQDGIIDKLTKILENKINKSQEYVTEKYKGAVG